MLMGANRHGGRRCRRRWSWKPPCDGREGGGPTPQPQGSAGGPLWGNAARGAQDVRRGERARPGFGLEGKGSGYGTPHNFPGLDKAYFCPSSENTPLFFCLRGTGRGREKMTYFYE
jgi:hypothetical protein